MITLVCTADGCQNTTTDRRDLYRMRSSALERWCEDCGTYREFERAPVIIHARKIEDEAEDDRVRELAREIAQISVGGESA